MCLTSCTTALKALLESIDNSERQIPQQNHGLESIDNLERQTSSQNQDLEPIMMQTMRNFWPTNMTPDEAHEALWGISSFECKATDLPAADLARYEKAFKRLQNFRQGPDPALPIERLQAGDLDGQTTRPGMLSLSNMWQSIKGNFWPSESSILRRFGGPGPAGPRLIRPLP